MTTWNEIRLPAEEDRIWELFHENSKLSPFSPMPGLGKDIDSQSERMHASLPVQSDFIKSLELEKDIADELFQRIFHSQVVESPAGSLSFGVLSKIFYACSKVMRRDTNTRTFHSPLELYGFITGIDGLPQGLYHFDPQKQVVQLMDAGVSVEQLSEALPDYDGASVYMFITALFQRTSSIFGERGYRIALTESGRLVQNIMLSCALHSLTARPIMNFYDRKVDRILGLDGVTHSVLQVIAI